MRCFLLGQVRSHLHLAVHPYILYRVDEGVQPLLMWVDFGPGIVYHEAVGAISGLE
jgi:hypothetical protein